MNDANSFPSKSNSIRGHDMTARKGGSLAEDIIKGLQEALAYERGEPVNVIVHEVRIPKVKVSAVRRKTGLSQDAFSKLIGAKVGTLRNWEQGRREPEGPAKTLLALIKEHPTIVQETFRTARRRARRGLTGRDRATIRIEP